MPKILISYQCIRCGYETNRKDHIRKHFYNTQKSCQARLNNIELTDEVKICILENRRYSIPKKQCNLFNQTVNNYHMLNNFLVQMDPHFKLDKFLEYEKLQHLDYEDVLEERFSKRVLRLENGQGKAPYVLDLNSLLNVIDVATKIDSEQLERFSVIFDKKVGRLGIYRGGEWESFIDEIGTRELVSLIKSYYLNTYELYLIKNIHHQESTMNRIILNEHLEIYYKFIAAFDLSPSILGLEDKEVLDQVLVSSNDHFLEERYINLYNKIKQEQKTSDRLQIKKRLSKIVKNNSCHNVDLLNKAILDILKIDDTFKDQLLEHCKLANKDKIDVSL